MLFAENKHALLHSLDVNTLNTSLDCSSGKLYVSRAITRFDISYWNISMEKFIEVGKNTRMIHIRIIRMDGTVCQPETQIRIKPLTALASMVEKVEQ
ncbi:hypothetical protein TSUD_383840 [Trifolium subterraneum]|uniref:Uncharacterized protein n=1 Tax=Trifolium subterraneum TaxID=3900 RepID=A0A2Z6NGW2_TRISU|nr:hypothetical protein TSUD_383840 [Trifolium subterraneum]